MRSGVFHSASERHVGVQGVLTRYSGSGRPEVSLLGIKRGELKSVFSDNLVSSVNTHLTDAGFHGINEAASCADACERRPSFKLLSFSATPPLSPLTRNHISQTNLIYNVPFVNLAPWTNACVWENRSDNVAAGGDRRKREDETAAKLENVILGKERNGERRTSLVSETDGLTDWLVSTMDGRTETQVSQ